MKNGDSTIDKLYQIADEMLYKDKKQFMKGQERTDEKGGYRTML